MKRRTRMKENNNQSPFARHNQFMNQLDARTAGVASALFDSGSRLRWANDLFCEAVGQPREKLEAAPLEELRLFHLVDETRLTFDELGTHPGVDLKSIVTQHLHSYWVRVNVYLSPDVQGEFEIACLMLKLATRNAPEPSAGEVVLPPKAESRYRSLLEEHPDLISICDKDGIRVFVNDSYCSFVGRPADQLLGTHILHHPVLGLPEEVIRSVFELSPAAPEISGIFELRNVEDAPVWIYGRLRAIFDHHGSLVEVITIGRDVTALKNAEVERSLYIEDLEQIAFMTSHKIRGPIATMMGLVELLRMNGYEPGERNMVFENLKSCIMELDRCSRQMSAFIHQKQVG